MNWGPGLSPQVVLLGRALLGGGLGGGTQHQHVRTNHRQDHVGQGSASVHNVDESGSWECRAVQYGWGPVRRPRERSVPRRSSSQPPTATPASRGGAPRLHAGRSRTRGGGSQKRGQLKVQQEGLGWRNQFLDEVREGPRTRTARTRMRTLPGRVGEKQRRPLPQPGASSAHPHGPHALRAPAWGWGAGAQEPTRTDAGSHSGGWVFPGTQNSV